MGNTVIIIYVCFMIFIQDIYIYILYIHNGKSIYRYDRGATKWEGGGGQAKF